MKEQIQKLQQKITANEESLKNIIKNLDNLSKQRQILEKKIMNQKVTLTNLQSKVEKNQEENSCVTPESEQPLKA